MQISHKPFLSAPVSFLWLFLAPSSIFQLPSENVGIRTVLHVPAWGSAALTLSNQQDHFQCQSLRGGRGEGGGFLGSKLCFIQGPLLWDSHSFPSYRNQPLSEQICFHKLSPQSARKPYLVPSRTPDWNLAGLVFASASCKYVQGRPDSHLSQALKINILA